MYAIEFFSGHKKTARRRLKKSINCQKLSQAGALIRRTWGLWNIGVVLITGIRVHCSGLAGVGIDIRPGAVVVPEISVRLRAVVAGDIGPIFSDMGPDVSLSQAEAGDH